MIYRSEDMKTTERFEMRGGNGTVKLTGLVGELPAGARLFSRIVLEKGVSIGVHPHEGETELFSFVSGSGRACDDGTWYDIKAGDAMSTPSGHSHGVENTGDEPLVIVACIVLDK